jgi:hypothetical protein
VEGGGGARAGGVSRGLGITLPVDSEWAVLDCRSTWSAIPATGAQRAHFGPKVVTTFRRFWHEQTRFGDGSAGSLLAPPFVFPWLPSFGQLEQPLSFEVVGSVGQSWSQQQSGAERHATGPTLQEKRAPRTNSEVRACVNRDIEHLKNCSLALSFELLFSSTIATKFVDLSAYSPLRQSLLPIKLASRFPEAIFTFLAQPDILMS